jgi:hypothetical protein
MRISTDSITPGVDQSRAVERKFESGRGWNSGNFDAVELQMTPPTPPNAVATFNAVLVEANPSRTVKSNSRQEQIKDGKVTEAAAKPIDART